MGLGVQLTSLCSVVRRNTDLSPEDSETRASYRRCSTARTSRTGYIRPSTTIVVGGCSSSSSQRIPRIMGTFRSRTRNATWNVPLIAVPSAEEWSESS